MPGDSTARTVEHHNPHRYRIGRIARATQRMLSCILTCNVLATWLRGRAIAQPAEFGFLAKFGSANHCDHERRDRTCDVVLDRGARHDRVHIGPGDKTLYAFEAPPKVGISR